MTRHYQLPSAGNKALEKFGSSIGAKIMCEELNRLKRDAALGQLEGKKIRESRDLTFREDAELSREQHRKLDAVLKHQLIGHDGKPCPDGFQRAIKRAPRVA